MLVSVMQFCERNLELCVLSTKFTNSDYEMGFALIGLWLVWMLVAKSKSIFFGLVKKNVNINRSWKEVFGLKGLITFNLF